jgi:hypothetical protein
LFGRPLFTPSIDHYFGWLGLGLWGWPGGWDEQRGVGVNGWEIARLWLYLLGSAMFVVVGAQLIIYWVLMRVLEELSQRETQMKRDLGKVGEVGVVADINQAVVMEKV